MLRKLQNAGSADLLEHIDHDVRFVSRTSVTKYDDRRAFFDQRNLGRHGEAFDAGGVEAHVRSALGHNTFQKSVDGINASTLIVAKINDHPAWLFCRNLLECRPYS